MKSIFLALSVFALTLPVVAAFAKPARESITITCLMHKKGADRLSEQKFILVDTIDQTLFYEDGVRYSAMFVTDADFEDKRLSAIGIVISDPASNSRTSARTTFKPSEGFSQLRIDIESADSSKPGPRGFFLCHGDRLP